MLFTLLIISFLLILIQDVRYRGVHWILFPIVLILGILQNKNAISFYQITFNLSFLFILLLSLTIYVSIKKKKVINISKGFFSIGDILFLLAIIPLFSPYEFIVFFTIGTVATLIIHLLVSLLKAQKTIPYAGYMSLIGGIFLFIHPQIDQFFL